MKNHAQRMDSTSYNVVLEIIKHREIASIVKPVHYGHLKLVNSQKHPKLSRCPRSFYMISAWSFN